MTVPVMFLLWNRRAYSQIAWDRLIQSPEPLHIVIVDNGSVDDTPAWVDTLSGNDHITLEKWRMVKNFGIYRTTNLYNKTMLERGYKYAAWCYNDSAPSPGWISQLTDLLDAIPDAGIAFPSNASYRPQNSTVNLNGRDVYLNNISYFSDAFGVTRMEVFKRRADRGEFPYIKFNNPGLSPGWFFSGVQGEWKLVSHKDLDQTWASAISNHNSEEAYRRQEVLVKRKWALDYPSHQRATAGIVTWVADGVEHQWLDEPQDSKGHPEEIWPQLEGSLTLRAALDEGVAESDVSLLA